jgi:hypothetical protein
MSISPELLYAILSLDSYNRGYNPGITTAGPDGLGEFGQVGPYSVVSPLSLGRTEAQYAEWQTANFYAAAYLNGGTIVISYRGTDDPLADAFTGWTTGAGFLSPQAKLAAEFYYQVKQEYPGANIVLTGHSLGGELAGFVARLTGTTAHIYDNMPFELSAENTLAFAKRSDAELVPLATISAPGGGVPVFSLNEYDRLMAERQIWIDLFSNGIAQAPNNHS